jgi:hypothetical protein
MKMMLESPCQARYATLSAVPSFQHAYCPSYCFF